METGINVIHSFIHSLYTWKIVFKFKPLYECFMDDSFAGDEIFEIRDIP